MRAKYKTFPASMNGRKGRVEIGFDLCGSYMTFTCPDGESILTNDDASVAETFIFAPGVSLREEWNAMHDADFVFESGLMINYEGEMYRRLGRSFLNACKHAKKLRAEHIDGCDYFDGDVYVRPVILED